MSEVWFPEENLGSSQPTCSSHEMSHRAAPTPFLREVQGRQPIPDLPWPAGSESLLGGGRLAMFSAMDVGKRPPALQLKWTPKGRPGSFFLADSHFENQETPMGLGKRCTHPAEGSRESARTSPPVCQKVSGPRAQGLEVGSMAGWDTQDPGTRQLSRVCLSTHLSSEWGGVVFPAGPTNVGVPFKPP